MSTEKKSQLLWKGAIYEGNNPIAFASFDSKEDFKEWIDGFTISDTISASRLDVSREDLETMSDADLYSVGVNITVKTANTDDSFFTSSIEEAKKFLDYYESEDFRETMKYCAGKEENKDE